jgi:hypothetical protein
MGPPHGLKSAQISCTLIPNFTGEKVMDPKTLTWVLSALLDVFGYRVHDF